MITLLHSKSCNINIVCPVSKLIFFSGQERSKRVCEELVQLHGELMFVKNWTDKESLEQYMKVHEKSKIVNQKLFKKYQEYQAGFQELLNTLRALPHKNPKTAGQWTRQEHAASFEAV